MNRRHQIRQFLIEPQELIKNHFTLLADSIVEKILILQIYVNQKNSSNSNEIEKAIDEYVEIMDEKLHACQTQLIKEFLKLNESILDVIEYIESQD